MGVLKRSIAMVLCWLHVSGASPVFGSTMPSPLRPSPREETARPSLAQWPYYGYPAAPYGSPYGYYTTEDPDYLILAMPFGVGQFYQDRTHMGLFFAITEIGGIVYIVDQIQAMDRSLSDERRSAQTTCNAPEDDKVRTACDEFGARSRRFRDSANQRIIGVSLLTFGLMLIGATDAITKDPIYRTPPLPPAPKRRTRPPRRTSKGGLSPQPPFVGPKAFPQEEDSQEFVLEPSLRPQWTWDLAVQVDPSSGNSRGDQPRSMLRWDLKLSF